MTRVISPLIRDFVLNGGIPAWVARHPRREYWLQRIRATPPWLERGAFEALKVKRDRLTAQMGKRFVLDHIVPLDHPMVCGLNVPWNITAMPHDLNRRKSNNWNPWQSAMFEQPEQLRLL